MAPWLVTFLEVPKKGGFRTNRQSNYDWTNPSHDVEDDLAMESTLTAKYELMAMCNSPPSTTVNPEEVVKT